MSNNQKEKIPFEIPVKENPGKAEPTKDPLSPNEKNPINPKTNDPHPDNQDQDENDQSGFTQKRE